MNNMFLCTYVKVSMVKFSEFELLGQGNCLLRTFYILRKWVFCQIFYNYFFSVCDLSFCLDHTENLNVYVAQFVNLSLCGFCILFRNHTYTKINYVSFLLLLRFNFYIKIFDLCEVYFGKKNELGSQVNFFPDGFSVAQHHLLQINFFLYNFGMLSLPYIKFPLTLKFSSLVYALF